MKRALFGLVVVISIATAYAVATAPARLEYQPEVPSLTAPVDAWLAQREQTQALSTPLIAGTEKRIRRIAGFEDRKTPYSIVYFHGLSATRMELHPVAERVAVALGANLFETRLAGHGLQQSPLTEVVAEDWLEDAAEALAVATALGEKVILMGTSTGATVALSLADQPQFERVAALVLVSPNFGPKDPNSRFLTWPGGPQLSRLMVGEFHSWEAASEAQAMYWSTHYPFDAVIESMRLVNRVNDLMPLKTQAALLMIYSPEDDVVDPVKMQWGFQQIDSPRKLKVELDSDSGSHHVIAGDIMAPQNNARAVQYIVDFIRAGD